MKIIIFIGAGARTLLNMLESEVGTHTKFYFKTKKLELIGQIK